MGRVGVPGPAVNVVTTISSNAGVALQSAMTNWVTPWFGLSPGLALEAGMHRQDHVGQPEIGEGGDDADWIGFRYSTTYDTTFRSAGYPQLTIGGVGAGEREVPNDSRLITQLEDRVAAELDKQFGNRASRLPPARGLSAAALPRAP